MNNSHSIVYITENENGLDREVLREAIRAEYHCVAATPEQGFHYHTGRSLIPVVGYKEEWLTGIPESTIASFAGTGNPFSLYAGAPQSSSARLYGTIGINFRSVKQYATGE